jgi:3-phosphoshikimate 1-carboxyvinyltransferase
MWSAIFGLNKDALLQALDAFDTDLATIRDAVASEDIEALRRLIDGARKRRQHYAGD